MLSPIFPQEHTEYCSLIKILHISPENKMVNFDPLADMPTMAEAMGDTRVHDLIKIEVQPITEDNSVPVESIEEAENLIINQVGLVRDFDLNDGVSLLIHINRAANIIGSKTQRGAGNIILMNPDDIKLFDQNWEANEDAGTIGRWTRAGSLNSFMPVFTSPDIPVNHAYVMYVSKSQAVDGPGGLIEVDGQLRLGFIHNEGEQLESPSDYIIGLRWTA